MADPYSLRRYLPVNCRLIKPQRRQNLVFVRLRTPCAFEKWYQPNVARNWDLMLSYYALPQNSNLNAEYISVGGLSKFSAVSDLYAEDASLFTRYDYILFLDDDIEMEFSSVDTLFEVTEKYNLSIGQPALTQDSFVSWPEFRHVPGAGLRYSNFIEVMMPIFSRDALLACAKTFNKSVSTWGLDQAWKRIMEKNNFASAVIDFVVARHAKPIDLENGAFYKFLQSLEIDPHAEGQSVWDFYGFTPTPNRILSVISKGDVQARLGEN